MLSSINTAAKTCKSGEHGLQVHISMTRLYLLVYEFYGFFFHNGFIFGAYNIYGYVDEETSIVILQRNFTTI